MIEEKTKYLFVDFPPFGEITEDVRESNNKRTFTGSVRMQAGKYRTEKEDKEYREQSLVRELP